MSDTDDTDVLVRLPPILVHTSDSEDSLGHPAPYLQHRFEDDYRQEVERLVVNDLLNQVNHLENRVCMIEQKDGSSEVNQFSKSAGQFSPVAKSARFGSSLDSACALNLLEHLPNNSNTHLSLPSTPQSRTSHGGPISLRRSFPESRSNSGISTSTTTNNMTHVNALEPERGSSNAKSIYTIKNENNQSPGDHKKSQPRYNKEMMEEIDNFLDNIKKTPQIRRSASGSSNERCREENLYRCGDLSSSVPDLNFGVRDFNHLPVREVPVVAKYFAPLEPNKPGEEAKHIDLREVETLLKEMDETQSKIEQKLRLKEAQFGRGGGDKVSFPRRPSLCGDDIGSVPDLGFGVRDLKSDQAKDKRVPVHEDRVIKRSMSLCGVNPGEQLTTHSSSTTETRQLETKSFVPKRLELGGNPDSIPDLGFGLKNWYKNNDAHTKDDYLKTSQESSSQKVKPYSQGENPSSIPDLGFGLRDLWTSGAEQSNTSQSQSEHKSEVTESQCKKKVDFTSESRPKDSLVLTEEYGAGKMDHSSSTNLLSLSNLWGSQSAHKNYDPSNLQQRLEEEKYRREHCERLILQLHSRLLEEQQKLAVAVQVDTGKDQAINHFQGAWTRLVSHWNELEEQRHNLALQLQVEREQHQRDISGTLEKLKRYESEITKAVDLAHGYKEKSENLEVENRELEAVRNQEIQDVNARVREHERAVQHANHERDDLSTRIQQLEEESKKDRTLLLNAKKELDKKSKTIESVEAELSAMKGDRASLQVSLKEEKSRNIALDQQIKSVRSALEESKRKEKSIRDEIKDSASLIEKMKGELRAFYQEQVEIVVRDKLVEFQSQLDDAEKSLRSELVLREQTINDMAVKQMKQLSDKCQLEIKLVEEKHKDELELYQMRLSQSTHHITKLQGKLKMYNSRKGEITEQLHGVMENQWQQVLGIIHGNRTQVVNGANGFGTWPKQNSVQSKDLLLQNPPLEQSVRSSITDDIPFGKDGQITYRARQEELDDDLKTQIEMLLRRPPASYTANGSATAKPIGSNETRQNGKQMPNNANATKQPQWEKVDQSTDQQPNNHLNEQLILPEYDFSKLDLNSVPSKDSMGSKPPWK